MKSVTQYLLPCLSCSAFIDDEYTLIRIHRESIPLISVGASLFVFVPTTFVRLSSAAIDSLMPAGRIRVISAGPFHNLLFWCLLAVLCHSGIGMALWSIPYRNISSLGRVVVDVEPVCCFICICSVSLTSTRQHSSLRGHLPVGSLITALGDVDFNRPDTLVSSTASSITGSVYRKGWCIDGSLFSGTSVLSTSFAVS